MGATLKWLAIAGLLSSPLQAQDVVGTWQGTITRLESGPLRLVAKIGRDGEALKATLYNADRSAPPIPVSTISFQGSTLRMVLPTMNATYEGRLSSDGAAIAGTFTQSSAVPLDFSRATPQATWAIPDPPRTTTAIAEDLKPGIEVATIKPSRPDAEGGGIQVAPSGTLTVANTPLDALVAMAYGVVDPKQLIGAPGWVESANFDITVKPDHEGLPNQEQLRGLLKALLAHRFRLKVHMEKKEQSVYALTVSKSGFKMTKVDPPRGNLPGFGVGPTNLRVNNATVAELAGVLSRVVGRPVVDRTGIEGRYDCLLRWIPNPADLAQLPQNERPPEDAADDVYVAIERQAGLHLESTKAPVDVVVIDTIERPSEN